jgi:D-alanine-D-alanine ligase
MIVAPESQDELVLRPSFEQASLSIGAVLTRLFAMEGEKVALPLLHGPNGEDGTIQGFLELLDIPYVGNGVLSSAVAMDKTATKELLASEGFRQAEFRSFIHAQWAEDRAGVVQSILQSIGLPAYVKPSSMGSSIGIRRCLNEGELEAAIDEAFRYDRKIVAEKEIVGREIQVAVMGNDQPLASVPGEFIQDQAFFDYEAKYESGKLKMSIPADIPASLTQQIRTAAKHVYRKLSCSGLARVDFFVDREARLYVNEVNTLPGFTAFSMYPVMWEKTDGTTYSALVEKLIDYAFARDRDKKSIQYAR